MRIAYVRPDNVGATWPLIKDQMIRVCETTGGRRTPAKVLAELMQNQSSLWVAEEDGEVAAFFTTRIIDYDAVRILGIELIAGDRIDEWVEEGLETFMKFAQDNGCAGIEGYGRGRAWARKLSKHGWKDVASMVEIRWDDDE